jgi:Family of unknown function (DUF5681)
MPGDDDSVGYRKPPKQSQFKPGQSGNPQGRKPQFGNFDADLLAELGEEISISEDGVDRVVTKQRAIIGALVTAALRGNIRAATTLFAICARSSPPRAAEDPELTSESDDHNLVKGFNRRQRKARTSASTATKKRSEDGEDER